LGFATESHGQFIRNLQTMAVFTKNIFGDIFFVINRGQYPFADKWLCG